MSISSKNTASLLRELRDRDIETGLLTTNRIYRELLSEVARSERYGNPLSCILLRVDGLGRATPKTRLAFSARLADVMRNTDFAGVWTDEEFLLVLPETDQAGADGFARKVQTALTDLETESGGDTSVSAKVASWRSGDDADALLVRLSTRYPS